MHAVLLFSATLHIAAIGLLLAIALRSWLETRRPKDPTFPETVGAAGVLGLGVACVATILVWFARGFGQALLTGLVAGALAAVAFLLALGALPTLRTTHGGPPTYAARMTAVALVAMLVLTELVAFAFLVTRAAAA